MTGSCASRDLLWAWRLDIMTVQAWSPQSPLWPEAQIIWKEVNNEVLLFLAFLKNKTVLTQWSY